MKTNDWRKVCLGLGHRKSPLQIIDLQRAFKKSCGLDGTRTRDLRRDRAAF
jgi:hypothetical protein